MKTLSDDELLRALAKTTGKSIPEKMTARNKEKKFVDDSVQWVRHKDPGKPDTLDDTTAEIFATLAGVPFGHLY